MAVLLRQQAYLQWLQQMRQMTLTALKQRSPLRADPDFAFLGICAEGTFYLFYPTNGKLITFFLFGNK